MNKIIQTFVVSSSNICAGIGLSVNFLVVIDLMDKAKAIPIIVASLSTSIILSYVLKVSK